VLTTRASLSSLSVWSSKSVAPCSIVNIQRHW
jgi:hypothetical protein